MQSRDNDLMLMQLPEELLAQIDDHLPPRWSRNNPVDCAGGETRDTIPTVMSLIAHHPDVHSVIYLGVGIQSNQAREMQTGQFYPDHGLERIVEYHERQDRRFAEAAARLSTETGKPILVATELAVADPNNAGRQQCGSRDGCAMQPVTVRWWLLVICGDTRDSRTVAGRDRTQARATSPSGGVDVHCAPACDDVGRATFSPASGDCGCPS